MSKSPARSQPTHAGAQPETRAELLRRLDAALARLCELYQTRVNPAAPISEAWTARDVLGHLTFWHESFARNVSALVQGQTPVPLAGTYAALNRRSVDEMHGLTVAQILERLRAAQAAIQRGILSPRLTLIPYRKGSRAYTPEEHLDVVTGHIAAHLKEVIEKGLKS